MNTQEPIIIIGAGQAGVQTADSLRTGGVCRHIILLNDETPLPYQRPQLSKDFLTAHIGEEVVLPLRPANFYADNDIELRNNARVQRVAPESQSITLSNGEELKYSHLVIATGTRARTLNIPGSDLAGIHLLRTLDDAQQLRAELLNAQRIVVVGAGFIGLEVAAVAATLGLEVTVLCGGQGPMSRAVSPEVSEWFRQHHLSSGIRLIDDESAQSFSGQKGQVTAVHSSLGNTYDADLVILGVGAVANVEFLQGSGLEINNGVLVDKHLRTSHLGVWALGDCALFPASCSSNSVLGDHSHHRIESVQNATDQARLLADNIIRDINRQPLEPYNALPWFWSHQNISAKAKLQIAGLRDATIQSHLLIGNGSIGKFSILGFNNDEELVTVESINAPADHIAARKILAGTNPLSKEIASSDNFSLKTHSRSVLTSAS